MPPGPLEQTCAASSSAARRAISSSVGNARGVAQPLHDVDGRDSYGIRSALGRLQHGGQHGRVAAIGQGQDQQGLRSGGAWPTRPPAPRSLRGPASSRAVVKPMANSALSADWNCSTNSGTPAAWRARIAPRVASTIALLGHVGLADLVVELARFGRLAVRPAAVPRTGCSPRQRPSGPRPGQSASDGSRIVVAAAFRRSGPGPRRRPRPPRRRRPSAAAPGRRRLGVAADADRVDHADQQPALDLARAPRAAPRRRPDRESLPGRSEPRRPVRSSASSGASAGTASCGAVDGQLLAGDRLVRRRRSPTASTPISWRCGFRLPRAAARLGADRRHSSRTTSVQEQISSHDAFQLIRSISNKRRDV